MSKMTAEKNIHHLDRVEMQFDRFSKKWRELYYEPQQVNDLVLQNRKDFCLDFLCRHVQSGSKILDVGCGAGIVALAAARKGYVVHGVDVAKKMIKLCQRLFFENDIDPARYAFTAGNIADLDLPEDSFDGILAIGFLEYQTDELGVLQSLRKLLRPGGVLIITGPINIRISGLFGLGKVYGAARRWVNNLRFRGENWRNPAAGISINAYSSSGFKKLLLRAGFVTIECKRHGFANFWPLQSMTKSKRFKIELFLHNMLTRIAKVLPIDRFANEIIAVAQK